MRSEQSFKPIQEKVMGFLVFGTVFSGFSFQSGGAVFRDNFIQFCGFQGGFAVNRQRKPQGLHAFHGFHLPGHFDVDDHKPNEGDCKGETENEADENHAVTAIAHTFPASKAFVHPQSGGKV